MRCIESKRKSDTYKIPNLQIPFSGNPMCTTVSICSTNIRPDISPMSKKILVIWDNNVLGSKDDCLISGCLF